MNTKKLQALYGLKWNPFTHDIPTEAIHKTERFKHFCYRVESLILEGGFALITGESGLGKSVILRALAEHLSKIPEITVGCIMRPQSGLADFYREMSSVFGVELRVSNRWGGYRGLREKWRQQVASTLFRPVLLVDEAQQIPAAVLSELRLLTMDKFDSSSLLTVVLAGDSRLLNAFKQEDLIPLGTRMRTRWVMESWSRPQLLELIKESISLAGNTKLMSNGLMETLTEHAAGSPRVMMNLAAECLEMGAFKETTKLDEGIFLELYPQQRPVNRPFKNKS